MRAKDNSTTLSDWVGAGGHGDPGGPGVRLLDLLQGQRLAGHDYSFKMSDATMLADRFLLGIHKHDISPARLHALCAGIGMPDAFLREFIEGAQSANAFHFGFEEQGAGGVYKVYLEYAGRLQPGRSNPVLLHLAYKWDCLDPTRCTIAKYICHPGLSVAEILHRLVAAGAQGADAAVSEVVETIVRLAASRTMEPLMYLEVGEERNPRASFDIKLYAAALKIADIEAPLQRLRLHYAIPEARFATLYARIERMRLGHLAGGISRDGKSFLTVYYEAEVS